MERKTSGKARGHGSTMAASQKLHEFIARVQAVSPNFEQKNWLRPLIDVLNDIHGSLHNVRDVLADVPPAKAKRYKNALYYLLGTYPGWSTLVNSVNFGPLEKLNAAEFSKTDLPQGYNPARPKADRIITASRFLNMTVEQFLISSPGAGVILIHLSKHDEGMGMVFDGEKCIDHIKSVPRVANDNKRDLCILHTETPPVLAALQAEVEASEHKVNVLEKQHMGARQQPFLTFAQSHNEVVVMGFDATICVEANLFGAAETMGDRSFGPPLTTLCNVVTSRAVLVSTGALPRLTKPQWGCLGGS